MSTFQTQPIGARLLHWWTRLVPRLHWFLSWSKELYLYALVGGFVFLLDVGTYALLVHAAQIGFFGSHVISRTIGGVACFLLNRGITFRGKRSEAVGLQLVRFLVLYGISFVASSVIIFLLVKGFRLPPVPGKVTAECLVFLMNYTVMKYWVIR